MGRATKAGASVAVPRPVIAHIRKMHSEGATYEAIKYYLNVSAVPRVDPVDGVPRPGLWTASAAQALLEANPE